MNRKVLIAYDTDPWLIQSFEQKGWQVTYQPEISNEEVIEIIEKYEGIVISSNIKIDQNFVSRANQLRFVARAGSGMENIDINACKTNGILSISSPEGNCDAVGEHALGMLLNIMNHMNRADREVRGAIWQREENRGEEIKDKTIGIIGYGHTGKAFAKKLVGFEASVLVYEKYFEYGEDAYSKQVHLDEIKDRCDVISFHLPLNKENEYFFDDAFLAKVKKPFYLINTSRGNVVKTSALLNGIKNGQVKGACLDVFENEKIGSFNFKDKQWFESLIHSDKVLLTPHVAGWTKESKLRITQVIWEKLSAQNLI